MKPLSPASSQPAAPRSAGSTDPAPVDMHAPDLYNHDAVAEPLNGLEGITDEHLEQFRERGYLAIENAFTPEEVASALQGMLDLIMGGRPDFEGIQFEAAAADRLASLSLEERQDAVRKLMSFVNYDERLEALASHAKLHAVLRRLMAGKEPKLFQDMGLIKPPKIGREKPWHQDCAYFDLAPGTPVVGVWIALDVATLENGCMRLLEGAHRGGPLIHWSRRDWQICDTDFQVQRKPYRVVAAPLKPGGLLLFDGLLPHGTPYNRSASRRRAVQYHYCPADAQWTDKQARLDIFGSEGKDVEC